jgi:regulator of RNase E activity RraA
MTQPTTATLTTLLLKDHGLRNTAIRGVSPVDPRRAGFSGRAVTVRYLPLREDLLAAQSLSNPEATMHRLLDSLRPGDVVVMDGRGHDDNGLIGDIIGARMHAVGVAGVVLDGRVRDATEIAALGLAVQCRGAAPPPSFANLMIADIMLPVACGGVTVFPGDQVVADGDGVCVVPAELWGKVAAAAVEQDRVERYIRLRVAAGERLAGLYPPNEAGRAAYAAWVARGEPPDRLT